MFTHVKGFNSTAPGPVQFHLDEKYPRWRKERTHTRPHPRPHSVESAQFEVAHRSEVANYTERE
jgi:hypothetical protein